MHYLPLCVSSEHGVKGRHTAGGNASHMQLVAMRLTWLIEANTRACMRWASQKVPGKTSFHIMRHHFSFSFCAASLCVQTQYSYLQLHHSRISRWLRCRLTGS